MTTNHLTRKEIASRIRRSLTSDTLTISRSGVVTAKLYSGHLRFFTPDHYMQALIAVLSAWGLDEDVHYTIIDTDNILNRYYKVTLLLCPSQ